MTGLTDKQIYLQVKRESVDGFHKGQPINNYQGVPSSKTQMVSNEQKTSMDKFSQDEMIINEQYAQYLPRGKRQLKLNLPELRNAVLANDLIAAPLTKTSGRNAGGNMSIKPDVLPNPKTQKEYIGTILNKNKLPKNPNPTSFKNNYKI
jgi:hypothetical protein